MKFDKSPDTIQKMFNQTANHYDLINNLISFGLHYFIKKLCIKQIGIKSGDSILDLCSGTGDIAEIIYKNYPDTNVIGADFSQNMLDIARKRNPKISFIQCDATKLPFDDNSFDVITMGFGLRNIFNAEKAIEEIYRVLKTGARFMHLDFGYKNLFGKIFDIIVLTLAKFLGKNSFAYEYLIWSKSEFPNPKDLIKDFESKGFVFVKRTDYLFGVISCQIMKKG